MPKPLQRGFELFLLAASAWVSSLAAASAADAMTNGDARVAEGLAFAKAGRFEQAATLFEAALSDHPDQRDASLALGTTYVQLRRYKEALNILDPWLARKPVDVTVLNNVAWILATADDSSIRNPVRALALASEACVQAPSDVHVLSTLAEAQYACSRFDQAFATAGQVVQAATSLGMTGNELAVYRAQLEKCRQAVQAFQLAE